VSLNTPVRGSRCRTVAGWYTPVPLPLPLTLTRG
jgi:hypothetical protein